MQKRRVMFKSLYVTINLWHNITSAPLSTKNSYCTVILCNFHNLYSHFTFSWHEMLEGWPIELSFPSPGHHVRNAHGQRWLLQVGIVEPPSGSKFIIQACDVARTCENLDDKYLQRDCEHGHAVDCSKIHLLLVTSCYTFWPLNDNLPLTSVSSSHRSCPSFVLALTVFFFLSFKPEEKTEQHTRLALACHVQAARAFSKAGQPLFPSAQFLAGPCAIKMSVSSGILRLGGWQWEGNKMRKSHHGKANAINRNKGAALSTTTETNKFWRCWERVQENN